MAMNPDLARILQALAETSRSNDASNQSPATPPSDPRLAADIIASVKQPPTQQHQQQQQTRNDTVDPSTITKWPTSVRYVTTNIVPDTQAMKRLKQMKEHQRTHEKLWWQNREAIVHRQNNRAGAKLQINQIFQNLGSSFPTLGSASSDTEKENETELRLYDEKMHKACEVMVQSLSKDLKNLGVPFFCADESKFEPAELQKLRKKMIEFLEDLISE